MGIALALRAERDAPPLWLLVLAAQGPDWIDWVSDSAGRVASELAWTGHGFPWLIAGAAATASIAAVLAGRRGQGVSRAALLVFLAYLSHWIADYVTGSKPTWPGGPIVGLRWYGRPTLDLALEAVVVAAGWWLWRRSLHQRSERPRRDGLAWALLAVLLLLQLAADFVMAGGVQVL